MEKLCDVCKCYYEGISETIEMSDENGKNRIHITGHVKCIDDLYDKIQKVKNRNKKTTKQILKEIKFKKDE